MPSPWKSFLWVLGMTTLFGLLVGTLNLMNPDAVYIPFGTDTDGNPQSAKGIDGVIASTLSSMVLGAFFGCLAALLAWVFRLGVKRVNETRNQ